MLTTIPFFRDVIISSFECPHCGFKNSELSPASDISQTGVEYVLKVENPLDLNRMVVKSDTASVAVPELELEIPAKSQKGEVTTVEGILSRVITGLQQDQARRKEEDPEGYEQIESFIQKIKDLIALTSTFSMVNKVII